MRRLCHASADLLYFVFVWTIILRDMAYRKGRLILVVVLIGVVMTLLFLLTGLVGQFNEEPNLATERVSGDAVWLVSDGSSGPFTSPQGIAPDALTGDGEPIMVGRGTLDGIPAVVVGRSYAGSDEPVLDAGRHPAAPGEVVVDTSAGLAVGDEVLVGALPATVVGVTSDATVFAGLQIAFVELGFSQDAVFDGRPILTGELLVEAPSTVASGVQVLTSDQVAEDARSQLESAIGSVNLMRVLLWLVAAIVIAAMIYVTALERVRDVAVLKAVGAADRSLAISLLVEAVIVALLATAFGAVLEVFAEPLFPMTVRVPGRAWWQIPLTASIVAFVAASAGVRKVLGTSAVEAFS